MSNYANLKSAIQSVIKTNGNNEITGQLLQTELLAMITTLGYGYQFMGVASPDTVPGTPDAKVFYIAYTPGIYTNFGGITVTGLCVLKYVTGWSKEDIPVSGGGGNFTVEPTDLTLVSGTPNKLKFADRPYNSQTPDGLGYKILRKDASFASQVTDTNTIYEIRYNFDLGGNEFSMPSGCTLYFVGGSLENGAIIGNNTRVVAPSYPVFIPGVRKTRRYILNSQKGKVVQDTHDLSISGTWDNDYVDPAWVGLLDIVQTEDNSLKLNKYFSLFKAGAKVIVPRNDYPVYNRVSVPQGASVDFCGSIIRNMNFSDAYDGTIEIPAGATEIPLVSIYGTLGISGDGVAIENLILDGGRDVNHDDDGTNLGVGSSSMLDIVNVSGHTKDVVVKNVHFRNISFSAVTTGEMSGNISFVGCSWNDVGEHSVYTHLVSGLFSMRDCKFNDVGNNTYAYNLRGASLIVKFAGNVDIDDNGPSQDLLNLRAEYHDCIFDNSGSLYGVLAPSSIILKSDFYGCRFSNILGYTVIASFTDGLERYAEYNFFGCTDPVTKYSAVNTISNLYDCHFTGSRSYFIGDRKNVLRCDGLLSYANDAPQSNFTATMQTLFPDVYAQRTIVKDCKFAVAGSTLVSAGINDYIGIDFYNTIFDFTKYTRSSTLVSIGSFSAVSDKTMNFFDCRFVFSSGGITIAYNDSKELIVNFYGGEKIGNEGNILTRAGVARLFDFIYQVRMIDVKNIPVFSIENSKFTGAYDAYYREIETTITPSNLTVRIPNSYGNGNYLTKQSPTFDLSRATKVYQLDNFAEEASYSIIDAITLYANGDTSYNFVNCGVEFSGITKATRVKIVVDLRHNYQ